MIDPREKLKKELINLGVNNYEASLISLDAGSSQCFVNTEYLNDLKIEKTIFDNVLKKIVLFYSGEMSTL